MSTETHSSTARRWMISGRLIGASVVCFFVLAVTAPNLGRVDLSNHKITYGWPDVLCVVVILAPLVLIFVGATRSRLTEYIGWTLLAVLVVLRLVSFAQLSH